MAHTCPDCGQVCHCNGDWDDIILYDTDEEFNCIHYLTDDCDGFEEDFEEIEEEEC